MFHGSSMLATNDPYQCPRCGDNIPNEHKLVKDKVGDPIGWKCPDKEVIWIWINNGITVYSKGTKPK